jgi:hypothetical protein
MDGLTASNPEPRAGQSQRWDGWRRGGTSGFAQRTNGGTLAAAARACLAVAAFIFLIDSVNVLSLLDEAARGGRALPAWIPVAKELSSGLGCLLGCGLVYLAMRLATPGRAGWPRLALVHALGTITFSSLHHALMTQLRIVIFTMNGLRYHRPPLPADWLYEYRKDVLAYAIIAGLFWLFQAPGLREPTSAPHRQPDENPPAPGPAIFDIIDGAKTLRVPVGQILAARAVRNYVEFLLDDGRRPLMRTSLATVESALASRGMLRTHRSWLVNAERLRSLEPTGSGDYRLGFDGDIQAPLSRRFPAALDRLRRGGGASSL